MEDRPCICSPTMLQSGQIIAVSPEPQVRQSSPPGSQAAGQPLYHYELRHCLGQRTGRQTWAALDLETPQREWVVLKLLAFSDELVWQNVKLFEREARVLQALDHPRLPRYRQSFSMMGPQGWLGIAQDYIPGRSLKEQLAAGHQFEEAEIRQIAIDVLHILAALHRLTPPILHRDIKPSNLIRGEDGEIYLIDWGAVQDRSAQPGHSFTVVGTYGYAPLEQFGGRAVPASDLYALGTSLIHLLCGTAPADLPQANFQLQFLDVPRGVERDRISPQLAQWLRQMIHPELAQRFASAKAAEAALVSEVSVPPVHSTAAETGLIARSYSAQPVALSALRPSGSQIQIQRSADLLVVELPGSDLGQVLMGLGGVFLVVSLLVNPMFLLLALLLAGLGGWLSASHFLRLERRGGDRLRLMLFRMIWGKMLRRTDAREVQSDRLVPSLQPIAARHQLLPSERTLVLQTEAGEYALNGSLTPAESRWLLEEIRLWLEMS